MGAKSEIRYLKKKLLSKRSIQKRSRWVKKMVTAGFAGGDHHLRTAQHLIRSRSRNSTPPQRASIEFPSPLQRASGTVLVELVELPMGPFSISTPDENNNNNNNKELSNEPSSHFLTSHSSSTSTGTENGLPSMSVSSSLSSISSISSSSLPPYSELVKELGTL